MNNKKETINFLKELNIEQSHNPIISVVGAGGKTSVVEAIAGEYKKVSAQAVVMTTTHMRRPSSRHCFLDMTNRETEKRGGTGAWCEDMMKRLRELLEEQCVVWIGKPVEQGKIASVDRQIQAAVLGMGIPVIIEADGAKGKPVKAPRDYEPVILPETTVVLNVYGMDAIGRPLEEVCHRADIVAGLLGRSQEDLLEPVDIARLAASPQGGRKGVLPGMEYHVILNKADSSKREGDAEQIRRLSAEAVHITSFRKHEAVLVLAAGLGRRFGDNKLLQCYRGKPIYRYMLENLTKLEHVQKVLVTRFPEVEEAAELLDVQLVRNENPEDGIAHSLHLGLEACMHADPGLERVLVTVCDQPGLKAETMERLLEKAEQEKGKIICASTGGIRRNPVVWDSRFFPELLELSGDVGGRQVIKRYPECIVPVEIDETETKDIDYPEDIWKEGS
ncbi:selenium cofactor biosynthesis protein YqeC [Hespellia stercorisuis]|uniref:MobA-like NTP transferase domain-containing protein n=1 Tax=Hespellia stercorisuis DSM 15480 TaxID=1121950 RepID=A0A1M6UR80_9FIRM|nr:selenium cofactor biosynthesis protein YqeC [Hespellia stercorisuis]SHK71752.1 MobA-like NTP transferase domain-containing protein [Hespellia stercorisuis DSM 15480]